METHFHVAQHIFCMLDHWTGCPKSANQFRAEMSLFRTFVAEIVVIMQFRVKIHANVVVAAFGHC